MCSSSSGGSEEVRGGSEMGIATIFFGIPRIKHRECRAEKVTRKSDVSRAKSVYCI